MDRQENNLSEKQPPKKPSAIRTAFICLFGGVLAFFLITAILFYIPWKVTTLLIVFLLACTALPKALRKWFWLSVGVVVLALVIWVFLPDDNEGWRPYTFDEELATLEAKYAIPDSENAAVIYNQLLDSYDANAFAPEFMDYNLEGLIIHERWASKDYPQAAEHLKDHEETITQLVKASKIDKCRFPVYAGSPSSAQRPPPIIAFREWANLLTQAANNDLGDKRIKAALEKYTAGLKLARHIRQQPSFTDTLIGIGLEALPVNQLTMFIATGDPTDEHLSAIEQALVTEQHWKVDFPKILEHDKLCTKNAWSLAYEVNSKGRIRLSRDPIEPICARRAADEFNLTYWQKRLLKANTILSWFYMPSSPRRLGRIIDDCYKKLLLMAQPDFDWERAPSRASVASIYSTPVKFAYLVRFKDRRFVNALVWSISEFSYYKFREIYLRLATERRGTLILIALRRYKNKHGFWPDFLDEIEGLTSTDLLIDPTNGGPFAYRRADDSFTLYSKGKDNIDDNSDDFDDLLIWPNRYYKYKEENTTRK
ncbi:MAG: hypothetical protein ACYSX1_09610 [Planctomycetota bacterium]